MLIIPAILELTTDKLIEQIRRVEHELPQVPYVHIDIMDGVFVSSKNEIDATQMEQLKTNLKYELHLMVQEPINHMHRWSGTVNMDRVIVHQESTGGMDNFIKTARELDYDIGIAVNPETEFTDTDYRTFDFANGDVIDMVQFMSVHPGRQGAPFEPSVLEKIKKFIEQRKNYKDKLGKPYHTYCSADGHVTPETAPLLKAAGVEIFNVGSFFSKAPNLAEAYAQLYHSLLNT